MTRSIIIGLLLCGIVAVSSSISWAMKGSYTRNASEFIVVNKLTAKRHVLTVRPEGAAKYERLNVSLKKCWIEGASKHAEHAALVDIHETKPSGNVVHLFTGWLFKNKSDVSNIEHRMYDVTLSSCIASTK